MEYAQDRVAGGADTAVHQGVRQARQQGGRLAGAVKEIKQKKSEVQGGQSDVLSGDKKHRGQSSPQRLQSKGQKPQLRW